ncbi:hypothetical protein HXX76_005856 [Chlamydomonas incerta]|uniref:Calcineurin-like phosphoesterase domain-containing protein n=1 Tax=Chlamydomonas incerta TaxID=51695 RepID=A0A835T537_CHLIN|nr:hypothetical protein HXX76_005856 [Chlamydomonas incerta]|eukprot:KAG2437192.1 hypothetical protein HXX76_005856 [Chlamydomonas incerta]
MASPFWRSVFPLALFLSVALLHYKYIYGGYGASAADADAHTPAVLSNLFLPEFDAEADLQSRYASLFLEAAASTGRLAGGGPADRAPPELAAARSALSGGGAAGGHGRNSTDKSDGQGTSRLVLLPDLHGDAQQAARALQLAGLIAPNYTSAAAAPDAAAAAATSLPGTWHWEWQWTGGDALLVQLGDVVDRGADSLALLGLLERLRLAAGAAGGRVRALLGNHELMLIHRDYRYVSRNEYRALGAAARLPPLWPGAGSASTGASDGLGAAAAGDEARDGAGTARGLAGSTAPEPQPSGLSNPVAHADSTPQQRREEAKEVTAEEEEERAENDSLRGELPAGRHGSTATTADEPEMQPGRQPDQDRELRLRRLMQQPELAQSRNSASSSASASTSTGGIDVKRRHGLLFQESQPGPQEKREQLFAQMQAGMELWRGGLAPEQPLGALIRRRPLALLAKGGGCEVLVVHAGAFPWMLTAVERAVMGEEKRGGQQQVGKDEGSGAAATAGRRLTPQQYVDAWNAVAAEALVHCDGRWCRHGGEQAASGQEGTGEGQSGGSAAARWRFRRELAELLLGGEGAVWSRRYIEAPSQQVCAEVAAVARRLGVQRVVVGHTVQRGGRVSSRCNGQLLMADVGLSRAIAGKMAVLTCSGGVMKAVYGEGQEQEL